MGEINWLGAMYSTLLCSTNNRSLAIERGREKTTPSLVIWRSAPRCCRCDLIFQSVLLSALNLNSMGVHGFVQKNPPGNEVMMIFRSHMHEFAKMG